MAARHINILIGCNEQPLVQFTRLLLSAADQGGTTFEFTESRSCDEFIRQACTGDFGVVLLFANCILPTPPLTLIEHSVLAIKTIKATRVVPIVTLTSMEEWLELLRAAGADACLPLPVLPTDLRNAVFSCVEHDT